MSRQSRLTSVALITLLLFIGSSCAYKNPTELPKGVITVPPMQSLLMCTEPDRWDPKWCRPL